MNMINSAAIAMAGDFSVGMLLQNGTTTIKTWGGYFIILLGVVMVIAAVWQIAKGLMNQGKGQTNWATVVLLFIIGGAFMVGGFGFAESISSGGRKTIEELGSGTTAAIYYNVDNLDI